MTGMLFKTGKLSMASYISTLEIEAGFWTLISYYQYVGLFQYRIGGS